MATYKCKMCGGDLQLIEGKTVCECEYCGSRQTVPSADDEKKMTFFNRANRLRFNNEFDKASGVYESIIADFPEEAEAYWGLILCKYGIEYVDDPATGKKIPTCHRSSFESVFDDQNFEMVMEYSDPISKKVYREESKQIEELRKRIIEVSSKEEPYDIFICYKETDENGDRTLDSVLAQDIYKALTDEGYRVFFSRISLEDKLGQEYEPYIFAALHSAKVMLAVGTQYEYYDAVWVKNEWSRFLQLISSGEKKTLIPVYKNLDAYDMPKEFAKLQAQDIGKVGAIQDLLRGIDKIFGKDNTVKQLNKSDDTGISLLNAQTEALLKRGYMSLEDNDYIKANDFFEQVLNNDPECGDAYWGKTLCSFKVNTIEELSKKLFANIPVKPETEVLASKSIEKTLYELDKDYGFLKDFSQDELRKLFGDCVPVYEVYKDKSVYYSRNKELYNNTNELIKLINDPSFSRAIQYKNESIDQKIEYIQKSLLTLINNAIQNDESNKAQAKNIALKKESRFITEVTNRYGSISRTIENEYRKQLEKWENAKKEYDNHYEDALAKKREIQNTIDNLEKERANLTGLFSGRKRKELEEKIARCRTDLKCVYVPADPGEKPVKDYSLILEKTLADSSIDRKCYVRRIINPTYAKKEEEKERTEKLERIIKYFGKYAFNDAKDIRPIKWKVLDVKEDKALIISEMAIETLMFNESKDYYVLWERCTLRNWLNGAFLNFAFTIDERERILKTQLPGERNPDNYLDPGNSTVDKIFLLSINEAKKYFPSNRDMIAKATPYTKSRGAYVYGDDSVCWWLRSPGMGVGNVANANPGGGISTVGDKNDYTGNAVRPAMWIRI